jgi:hypothetical protein
MNNSLDYKCQPSKIDTLHQRLQKIENDVLYSPCIIIEGFRYLANIIINNGNYTDIIYSLFKCLNLPISWILNIKHPYQSNNTLPFEIHVLLITKQIKDIVFKTVLNFVKQSKLKYVYVHCPNL